MINIDAPFGSIVADSKGIASKAMEFIGAHDDGTPMGWECGNEGPIIGACKFH